MAKLAFFLLDGLTQDAAKRNLGFLEHLSEKKQAVKISVKGELPSLSRPMYETIFTGLPVYRHGITNNKINDMSKSVSVFDICQKAGLTCLSLAYHWISELYIHTPFNPQKDMFLDDESKKIQHGFFYYEDQFPDSHLYSLAMQFIDKYQSDFVFVHPMNIDLAGHMYGSQSQQYHETVNKNDLYLSTIIPFLIERGYSIMVASDHGMNEIGLHGGNEDVQRNSLMYVIHPNIKEYPNTISTLQFAPMMCQMLKIAPSEDMEKLEVKFSEK